MALSLTLEVLWILYMGDLKILCSRKRHSLHCVFVLKESFFTIFRVCFIICKINTKNTLRWCNKYTQNAVTLSCYLPDVVFLNKWGDIFDLICDISSEWINIPYFTFLYVYESITTPVRWCLFEVKLNVSILLFQI